MIETLLSFAFATLLLALSPGPDNIYVLSQALVNGTTSGLATTAGLISGCVVHTSLLAFGISAIITTSPILFYGIKVLGAIYLFYLAYQVYKSSATIDLSNAVPKKSKMNLYKQGVIMNLVNPKVMIFFLAFFPGFIWDETQSTVFQIYILGLTFMVVSFITFGMIALLAGGISTYLKQNSKVGHVLKWLQILVFVGIGVFILVP